MGGFRPFSLDRPRHNEIAGAALDMLRPKGEGGGLFGGSYRAAWKCLIKKLNRTKERRQYNPRTWLQALKDYAR
jgi:hypothetical protein